MKVVKQWYDDSEDREDGFTNIFMLDDDSCVFTSEKRMVWRDEGLDLLDESYKCPLSNHSVRLLTIWRFWRSYEVSV